MYAHYNVSQSVGYGMQQSGMGQTSTSSVQMDEAAISSILQAKSMTELQQILEDDEKLKDIVNGLKQVDNITIERETLLASNKSLADYNLSLQPRFEQLKQEVAREYEQLNSLKTELTQDIAKLDIHASQQSLDTLLAVLQTEAAKAEEETENLADEFCSKKLDINDFIAQYLPKRTQAHTRRIKAEKMSEIIRNPSTGSRNSYHGNTQAPAPYQSTSYHGGQAPYPSSNAMPMPFGSGY